MKRVSIYTDGACSGNPGPGGYGVVLLSGKHRLELSQGFRRTTNNRMEILAVIAGLERLKEPCQVTVYSDSKYVINTMTLGWLKSWQARGWRNASKKRVKNVDLWKRLEKAAAKHEIKWRWVKGHAGNPENERCDELATAALRTKNLSLDTGFEQNL